MVQKMGAACRELPGRTLAIGDLSPPQQKLLDIFREIGFGQILGLSVREGEPLLDSPLRFKRTVRLDMGIEEPVKGERQPFLLKTEAIRFFHALRVIDDGVVARIQVQEGLPKSMEIEGTA